jgi:hypothetical protein
MYAYIWCLTLTIFVHVLPRRYTSFCFSLNSWSRRWRGRPRPHLGCQNRYFPRRRGKYLLFSAHFKNEEIPLVWHRLNEVRRKAALHHFLDSPDWLDFAGRQEYVDLTRTSHQARLPHSRWLHDSQADLEDLMQLAWGWLYILPEADSRLRLDGEGTSEAGTVLL